MPRLFLALLGITALSISSCAPAPLTARTAPPASGTCAPGTRPVTGIAVQSVFDGDYGPQLTQYLTRRLNEEGFRAYRSTDYPDVNAASISITGLIDHWANAQDQAAPRVGAADILISDRNTGTTLNRFQLQQSGVFFAPSLPDYGEGLLSEIQRRYCQV